MRYNELLDAIRKHHDKLNEQYGEIMEDDELEMSVIENDLESWCNYLIQKAREDKAQAQAAKDLAAHYSERAKQFERREEYRKLGIYTLVQMAGKPIKTVAGNASIQNGRLGVVVNCPPEMLPDEYKKVTYSADKEAIKKDLEAGRELNYAVLERGKPFLTIR